MNRINMLHYDDDCRSRSTLRRPSRWHDNGRQTKPIFAMLSHDDIQHERMADVVAL